MQTLSIEKRLRQKNANAATSPSVGFEKLESIMPLKDRILDLDEARLALGEAARIIGAQEKRIRQLENLALTDELTGLTNRRGLLLAMQREIAAAGRDDQANGVIVMVDLDGFKGINDQWGHAAGDEYLQQVAHALTTLVRASDVVTRLGGDEFAILLTRIDEETALERVARLEKEFNSQIVRLRSLQIPLAASFGHASYRGTDTPEKIMAAADLKLYAHKISKKTHVMRG